MKHLFDTNRLVHAAVRLAIVIALLRLIEAITSNPILGAVAWGLVALVSVQEMPAVFKAIDRVIDFRAYAALLLILASYIGVAGYLAITNPANTLLAQIVVALVAVVGVRRWWNYFDSRGYIQMQSSRHHRRPLLRAVIPV